MGNESKSSEENFFKKLNTDPELKRIYNAILHNYTCSLFGIVGKSEEFSLNNALRYIALLSKSRNWSGAERQRQIAQEMISLLYFLNPDNPFVKHFLGSTLTSIGNFPGVAFHASDYQSSDILERIYDRYNDCAFAIPTEQNKKFSSSQKEVFDHLSSDYYSYSGPTSMGKTFLIRIYVKSQILHGSDKNFAIIVPTKALINEVSSDVISDLKDSLEERNYRVVTSLNSIALDQPHRFIFVMTPERLQYLLIQKPKTKVDFAFFDEAYNISEEKERSAVYFKLTDMLVSKQKAKIIFGSPNVPNPELYLTFANPRMDESDKSKHSCRSEQAPVSQIKYLLLPEEGIVKPFDDLLDTFSESIKLPRKEDLVSLIRKISECSKTTYSESQCLVYCSSKEKAIQGARRFYENSPDLEDVELNSFSNKISEEISHEYFLAKFVKRGIAFHIGYLPSSIRLEMERLFKLGKIRVIFCTSTLIEGVNLPANNLFVTSYKNGMSGLSVIDFKNLIGRAGRINFNLFGNVFLVCQGNEKLEKERKFSDLVNAKPEMQKLSVTKIIKKKASSSIITNLKNGDPSLDKSQLPTNTTFEKYSLARKFSSILLTDVVYDHDTFVRRTFQANGMTKEDEATIRKNFLDRLSLQGDDIDTSLDQSESLSREIAKGDLAYPIRHNGKFDFTETKQFLNRLADIFLWDKYEQELVGKDRINLSRYAALLIAWMGGYGLGQIITSDLNYRKQRYLMGRKTWVLFEGHPTQYDPNRLEFRNAAMAEVLDNIQSVILFSFSNYFLKFSTEYKRQYGEEALSGNDWYEFVEFGSCNVDSIFLQRSGFSRESADYLLSKRDLFTEHVDGKLKLKKSVIEKQAKADVKMEAEDVFYNNSDLFI